MTRSQRVTLIAGAAVLCGAAVLLQTRAADTPPAHTHHAGHFDQCARICAQCLTDCESCYAHCAGLLAEGHKDHATTAEACNDCADLCRVSASLSARGSLLAPEVCDACAAACDRCVVLCGEFKDDAHMQQCAKTCGECAAACREMVQHAGHRHP